MGAAGRVLLLLWTVLALAGCGELRLREGAPLAHVLAPNPAGLQPRAGPGPVLAVSLPGARPGYSGVRMAYVQRPFELSYFARNEWADTPARMLSAALIERLGASGLYRAVVPATSGLAADLRLDTEIVALHQDFQERPSRARVELRARLVDPAVRREVAARALAAEEPAAAEDPYGGVVALNRALAAVLDELEGFCAGYAVPTVAGPER